MKWTKHASPMAQEALRERIEAAKIVEALKNHVVGGMEMSSSQVAAGLGLLRKVVPDLSSIEAQFDGNLTVKNLDVNWVKPK